MTFQQALTKLEQLTGKSLEKGEFGFVQVDYVPVKAEQAIDNPIKNYSVWKKGEEKHLSVNTGPLQVEQSFNAIVNFLNN